MPIDAPEIKKQAIKGYGAEVIFIDLLKEDIYAVIAAQQRERKMTYISPFDNANVIAGQGTCALELI